MIRNSMLRTSIHINNSIEGETLEDKVERIINNNEGIEDTAPLVYTEKKNGVMAEYNIRTDRWEIAIDALDKATKSNIASNEGMTEIKDEEIIGDESIQGTK